MENEWIYEWVVLDSRWAPLACVLLLHLLFSDKAINKKIIVHCALVAVVIFMPKLLARLKTLDVVWAMGWYVFFIIVFLLLLTDAQRPGYDRILRKKIWGAYYQDIGVDEHMQVKDKE